MAIPTILNERDGLWLLKNSFQPFQQPNFVPKSVNVRSLKRQKLAETTAVVRS
jgi:hypothetical protein